MYYNLLFISQHPSDLSWPPALLQLQGEHVVIATQADQDPLAVIHSLAPQLQCVWAITQVGTDTHVAIYYLHEHIDADVKSAVVLLLTTILSMILWNSGISQWEEWMTRPNLGPEIKKPELNAWQVKKLSDKFRVYMDGLHLQSEPGNL